MNRLIKMFLLPAFIFVFGATGAYAAADAPAASAAAAHATPKIGVIDWQQLLQKAPQAEAAGKRLEGEFQGRKDKLIARQKEYQTKQEKLARDRDTMSESERGKSEKELAKIQQDLRHMDEELRSDYTTRHREEMDDFLAVVRDVVGKLASEEKYDLVIPQEATVYMADSIDITDKVLQKLSKMKPSAKSSEKDKKKD